MPAGVVKFKEQILFACDPGGEEAAFTVNTVNTQKGPNQRPEEQFLPASSKTSSFGGASV
jgi:hypothetical protein